MSTNNMKYKLLRRGSGNHNFWLEVETGRLVIGDHSGDDRNDNPTKPTNCEDGVLYVDTDTIKERGLTPNRDHFICPLFKPDGKPVSTVSSEGEARWLTQFVRTYRAFQNEDV